MGTESSSFREPYISKDKVNIQGRILLASLQIVSNLLLGSHQVTNINLEYRTESYILEYTAFIWISLSDPIIF